MNKGFFIIESSTVLPCISEKFERKLSIIGRGKDTQIFAYVNSENPSDVIVCGKFLVGELWIARFVDLKLNDESQECLEFATNRFMEESVIALGLESYGTK